MDRASASEAGNMGSTPVGRKFENRALAWFYKFKTEAHQLLGVRREAKAAAMFLFERAWAAKGKNREARPVRNFRQGIYCRGLPSGANFFFLKRALSLLSICLNTSALPRRFAQYTSQMSA